MTGRRLAVGTVALAALAGAGACRQTPRTDQTTDSSAGKVEQRQSSLTVLSRTGWTASASSTGAPDVASRAIDGTASTRWRTAAAQATNQFFQVDMGARRTFTEIVLDATGTPTEFPRTYKVQVANDNSSWATVPNVATGTGTTAVTTIAFAPQTAQFIRVTLTAASAGNFWSIHEFNVYGTTLSRAGWTATASSTSGTNVAGNALDGSTTTRWSSAGAQTGQSFKVDMKSPRTFNQIVMDAGTTTNNFPRGYAVFVSMDDVNFGSAVATGTGTTAFMVVTFPTQYARYIRIDQTATNSTTWSIQELNVEGQPTAQVAQPRAGWVPTASSTNGTNVALNALDGSATTRWTSASAQTGQSFRVDMLTSRLFDQITLDAGTSTNNFPRGYQVDISNDGTNWTTITSGSNSSVLLTITLTPARTARHIRINQTATNSNPWSIQEMNVIGPALSVPGWVATATSNSTGNVPASAIDGSASTRWSTVAAQTNQSFTVDMGTAQVFNQLTLDAGTTTNNFPRAYSVFVSNDGVNFGSAVVTGTGTSQLVTINFANQTARFFRITQTATNSTTWSIQELNVWRIGRCDLVTCTGSDQCHVGVCDQLTGACSNQNAPNGTSCNDGNSCTQTDACQSGVCTGSNPVVCTASDQCHDVGVCNTGTGVCSNPAKTNGSSCNDGNACTQTDACQSGVCTGSNPVVCTASDQCHDVGVCNTGTGVCSNPAKTNGSSCNDGNACMQSDTCQSGACTGASPVLCMASDQCHDVGVCNTGTGVCSNPAKTNGSSCNDGNACTQTDACQSGVCTGSNPVVCTASDQCHDVGVCNTGTGVCSNPAKTNGSSCNDGNACTQSDACQSGACTGANPVVCTASDQCHDPGVCNTGTGVCSNPAKMNGTACSDSNACTQSDTCQAGVCTGANPVTCTVQDQCHVAGTCNPATGTCSSPRATDGTACTDDNRCTSGDSCQAGTCLPGTTNTCAGTGQANYVSITDLGSAFGRSYATGINSGGVVVGTDGPDEIGIYQLGVPGARGFRWSPAEGVVYLPWTGTQSYAVDINDTGVMSVTAGRTDWEMLPCRYNPAVDPQPVCHLGAGTAFGINASGTVTGKAYLPNSVRMFRLGTGPIEALPSIPSQDPNDLRAIGNAIADDGSVVGIQSWNGAWPAVRYTATRGTEFLADLLPPGSDWYLANAAAIRPDEILGWGTHGGFGRAFRMKTNAVGDVTEIVALPMPSTFAPDAPNVMSAIESNASHEIVGAVWDSLPFNPQAAYVYTDATGTIDLNTLIDPQSGWNLKAAYAINDNHEVVGFGSHDGGNHAFKLKLPNLSPCPPPVNSCHLQGTRDLLTGLCSDPVKADGNACNDGNACTQTDTCQSGTCTGANAVVCTAQDQCHDLGSCDPTTGQCSNPVKLDPAAGPFWNSKAPMATPRYGPAGIAFGGLTYVFGGCDQPPCGGAFTPTVEAYDPVQNTWSPRAPMPTARATTAAATIDGTIYVVGGMTASNLPPWKVTVEAYNPVADAWTTKASMQSGRASPAIGAIGGKLYVCGGHFNYPPGSPDFVESYDPATDVWTTRGPVPTDRYDPAYGVIGGKLYVAGGLGPDRTVLDTLEAYDPATDSWTSLRRMPKPLEGPASAVVGGKLYVLGGSTASSNLPTVIYDKVYIYDPAGDSWSVGPTMTVPRYGSAAVVNGETILLAGGYTASGPTTVVDSLAALRGPPCDDTSLCTQGDTCQAGTCVGVNAVVCVAQDQCHVVGTCAPATGTCSNPIKANGTTCNDGQTCTQSETCQSGTCQASGQFPPILNLGVEQLGQLGGNGSLARDINASGQTVGHALIASGQAHAFSRNPGGPMVDLGSQLGLPSPNAAFAINDGGTVVGYMTAPDGTHAFRDRGGVLDDLGLVGDGSTFTDPSTWRGSVALDVNSLDQVVGAYTDVNMLRGYRYTDGIGFEDIGSLAGGMTIAWAINASGLVGGSSWVPGTPQTFDERRYGHAVIFQNDTVGLVDLNDLIDPLLGWTLRVVTDMAGEFVVGTGERNGVLRGYRLRLSTGAIDDIAAGWEGRSFGQGVNSQGDVAGNGSREAANTTSEVFVYSDRIGLKRLSDMIDPASGWNLTTTFAINDAGDVVGWGFFGGNVSAYRVRVPLGAQATCQARSVCGGDDGDAVCLYSDGVVETTPGHFVAVFGYDNASAANVHPTTNEVRLDGNLVANPQPTPPTDLLAGTHTGSFLPTFDSGHTIAWTVGGETVTASASSPRLQPVVIGNNGVGVVIGGTTVVLIPDGMGPCPPPASCQNPGTRDAQGICVYPTKSDGTACDDGNACTRTDVCQAGACVGANPVACIPPDTCHTSSCNPATGVCSTATVAGNCSLGAFDYDKAGRLIRDRTAELHYDGYDQLREVLPVLSPPPLTGLHPEDLSVPGAWQTLAGHSNSRGQLPVSGTMTSGVLHTVLIKGVGTAEDLNATVGISTSVYGSAMNDRGAVAGSWQATADGHYRAFRYDETGFHDLGNPGDDTLAYDLNNANQVVGTFTTGAVTRGYRHTDATGFDEIGTLGGAQSWAWRIDELGTVSASAQRPDSPSTGVARFGHAALYHDVIGLQDLNTLIDPMAGRTLVIANEKQGDWVVGVAMEGDTQRAYRLKLSTGALDDIGWAGMSSASSVNSAGDAVGWAYVEASNATQVAWILSERTGFAKLNDLIDPASGWDLRVPSGIDDFGDVVGWGYHNGVVSAFRLRIPAHSTGTGGPMVAEVHTYGFDGLRTSTTTAPGTGSATTQFWFTQDYTQRNGVREHYVRLGDRLIARVTAQPAPGGGGMGVVSTLGGRAKATGRRESVPFALAFALMLLAIAGAALGFAKRRRRWVPALAGSAALLFGAASCGLLGSESASRALDWSVAANLTHYFHSGISPGPNLITDNVGALVEERRYEPFGQPIPAVNIVAEPQNILGKLTNPNTGWSYHGARWMQPQSGRWTAPDPLVKGPTPDLIAAPWKLSPYAYASQSPTRFWDPTGLADKGSGFEWDAQAANEEYTRTQNSLAESLDMLRQQNDALLEQRMADRASLQWWTMTEQERTNVLNCGNLCRNDAYSGGTAADKTRDLLNEYHFPNSVGIMGMYQTGTELAFAELVLPASGFGGFGAAKKADVVTLDARAIRFSQSNVRTTLPELVQSMKASGWQGAPIDVVRMADGSLTAIDNTRLAAAALTKTPVQAVIRGFGEAFPAARTGGNLGGGTWGEAILSRIAGQKPAWQRLYPNGSYFTGVHRNMPGFSP